MRIYLFYFFLFINFFQDIQPAQAADSTQATSNFNNPNYIWNMLFCKDKVRYIGQNPDGSKSLRVFSSTNPKSPLANTASLINETSGMTGNEDEEDEASEDNPQSNRNDKIAGSEQQGPEEETTEDQEPINYNVCLKRGKLHECLQYAGENKELIQDRFKAYTAIAAKESGFKKCKLEAAIPNLCALYENESPLAARIRWKAYNSTLTGEPEDESDIHHIKHTFNYRKDNYVYEIDSSANTGPAKIVRRKIADIPDFQSELQGIFVLLPKVNPQSSKEKDSIRFTGVQTLEIEVQDYSGPFITDDEITAEDPPSNKQNSVIASLEKDFFELLPSKEDASTFRIMRIYSMIRNLDLPIELSIQNREANGNPLSDNELKNMAAKNELQEKTIVDVKIYCWQGDANSASELTNPDDQPEIFSGYMRKKNATTYEAAPARNGIEVINKTKKP